MDDAADGGFDRTREVIGAETVGDDPTLGAILLRREGELHEVRGVKIDTGTEDRVDGAIIDVKLHVRETKRRVIRGGTCVLTWAIECDGDEVGSRLTIWHGWRVVGSVKEEEEDNDGDRLHTGWGGILFLVAAKLP
jgi:hypothetical protein